MSRIVASILLAAILREVASLDQLCSTTNTSSKCICGYDTFKSSKRHYVVDCARIDLQQFPDIRQLPPHVNALDVSQNVIRDLTFDNEDFSSVTLRILNARFNDISEVSVEFMHNIPALNHLDLGHNKITRLDKDQFKWNTALHHLDLSYNNISELPDGIFRNLKGLKLLDISYNYQLGVQIGNYKNLLTSPLGLHNNLTTFNANYVNLTRIPKRFFENLTLTSVSLADNNLLEIPLFPETLKTLDLSGNQFKRIDASHMYYTKLQNLQLNRMYALEKIKPYAFYTLESLEVLSIENCPYLKHFDGLAFGVLLEAETWSMREMSLTGNSLKSLNDSYEYLFKKLERIDLSDNPWVCDCDILWFERLEGKISRRNMRCASPRKYKDRDIFSLSEQEIPQCSRGSAWRTHKMLVIIISVLVVALMAIVVFLIYSGPFRSQNNQSGPIGATSPYNSLVVQDEMTY